MKSESVPLVVIKYVKTIDNMLKQHKSINSSESTQQVKKDRLVETFLKAGWMEPYLQIRFKYLTDKMLNSKYEDEEIVRGFAHVWQEEVGFDTTIEHTLMRMGIKNSVAAKADDAISPLIDTCYTNSQLIGMAVNYILGFYKSVFD